LRLHKLYLEAVGGAAVEYEGANEVAVAELTGVTCDVGSREVFLIAVCYFTLAAATTTTTIRIRRGLGVLGTEVGKCVIEGVAAKKNECSFQVRDVVGELANASYSLTMQEGKAGEKPKSVESRLRAEF
jgi:hypothetical protein